MADDQPVDLAELAEMCGLGYRTVLTYRSAGKLPDPDGYVGRSPWWKRSTVRAWHEARAITSG